MFMLKKHTSDNIYKRFMVFLAILAVIVSISEF